jgi:hypothetical protein
MLPCMATVFTWKLSGATCTALWAWGKDLWTADRKSEWLDVSSNYCVGVQCWR